MNVGKGEHLFNSVLLEVESGIVTMEINMEGPQKARPRSITSFNFTTLGYILKGLHIP